MNVLLNIHERYHAFLKLPVFLRVIAVALLLSAAEAFFFKFHDSNFLWLLIYSGITAAVVILFGLSIAKKQFSSFAFVLPAIVIFFIFYIYPFFTVLQLSHYDWDGIMPTKQFIGFSHFIEIAQDKIWWQSMGNAFYITFIALTFQNLLALLLALACDKQIKGGNIYRVIFFIPPVLSEVVVGLVWRWIYDGNYGILNFALAKLGLAHWATNWLSDPNTALTAVAVIHSWKGFGWGFIILLAGLQTIPRQLYEAARVDGANAFQLFKNVTLPLMVPVLVLVAILTILGTMQVFVLILSMTGGGPGYHTEVPVTRILASMISSSRFGYACAQSILFGVILVVLSTLQSRISKAAKQ